MIKNTIKFETTVIIPGNIEALHISLTKDIKCQKEFQIINCLKSNKSHKNISKKT